MAPKALDGRRTAISKPSKHSRVRSGCLVCRQRRKKCDEKKPTCEKCERMGLPCRWPTGFTFKLSGPGIAENTGEPTAQSEGQDARVNWDSTLGSFAIPPSGSSHGFDSTGAHQQQRAATSRTFLGASANAFNGSIGGERQIAQSPSEPFDGFSGMSDDPGDWLPQMSDAWSWSPLEPMLAQSPDTLQMYYPNAEYRALHTTLYNYMVDTALAGNTRQATPVPFTQSTADHTGPQQSISQELSTCSSSATALTARREQELWANYLDEVTDWLDMFDNNNHFKIAIPAMAQSSKHLKLALLALSSRQLERRHPDKPYVESLGLYAEAIQLINNDLSSMSTAVIASCVLLCVLEMMSSSPNEWARHLDGCAMLLTAAGVHGAVGGTKQAIFWCFARMDLWRGFLTDSNTKIPTSLWYFPGETMADSMSRLQQDSEAFDQYANLSTFLCASALQIISVSHDSNFAQRWIELSAILEQWHKNRPVQMRPVFTSFDKTQDTFPIIVFSNPPAISGNQMFHAASLLMLQAKPKPVKAKSKKSMFWHARQIVGISTSNRNHGAWTNAPQSLWIAGRLLSHPDEHRVVLETLHTIELETGFATAWRGEDLKAHWGDFDSD